MTITKNHNIRWSILSKRFEFSEIWYDAFMYPRLYGQFENNLIFSIKQQIEYDYYGKQFIFDWFGDYTLKKEYENL